MSPSLPPSPPGEPQVQSLTCPGCGAPLTVRSMGRAVSIVCDRCHSILDAKDPHLRILQRFEAATGDEVPLIPLGSRGKWRGAVYETIGFQVRTMEVEGITYSWREYLLFNPYKGFRYLTEYNGHWNDCSVVTALPELKANLAGVMTSKYLGKTYKHFQTCLATTTFVLGEFPWQVAVNDDGVTVSDYVAPPYVLSSETVGNETTWTLGEYIHGADIWKAFGLAGSAPTPVGVYENQPSQLRASAGQTWFAFAGLFTAIFVIFTLNQLFSGQEQVFQENYRFSPSSAEASFVTPVFELKGRTSSVEVKTDADVSNQWIYLNYALVDDDTGKAYDFGREVSYYSGVDSDGAWQEGGQHDRVVLPSLPPGHYYLLIEPESDANLGLIGYTVTVTRDVPVLGIYLAALAALLLPALLISWRTYNFEQMRWAESDHPMRTSQSDE
ncbi:MAG TPA: DUF4178 domain-containing protein [Bryobacteraceae bacterium]|nr:DUF4178 domain-containing protein [Bryobacteraceae bacterium]